MIRKISLLAGAAAFTLFPITQAAAAEHIINMSTLTLESGWTAGSGVVVASNVFGKRAYKLDSTVHDGDTLRYSLTISGYSGSGQVMVYGSGVKMACAGVDVPSPNGLNGEFDIPDNFNPATAYTSTVGDFPSAQGGLDQRETDPNGAFRFNNDTGKGHVRKDDPMVCPGKPGSSHDHYFVGNTGTNAFSTYKSLRRTGGSTCSPDNAPVCRTAYWMPIVVDGNGNYHYPAFNLTYYKQIPMGIPEMQGAPDATHAGIGVKLPNGLRYIAGCDLSNYPLHCPINAGDITDPEASLNGYSCHYQFRSQGLPGEDTLYGSIAAARANSICSSGHVLWLSLQGPICWNGTQLDTVNHRSHMAVAIAGLTEYSNIVDSEPGAVHTGQVDKRISIPGGGISKCDLAHPYQIVSIALQFGYLIDSTFPTWHLSSDEQMGFGVPDGATLHFDYWDAWSPDAKAAWTGDPVHFTGCENGRNNGNFGLLCDGRRIIGGNAGGHMGDVAPASLVVPRSKVGYSRVLSSNGTYTGEIKVQSGGEIGLYGIKGFSGTIALTLTDVTKVGKHNSTGVTTH